MKNKIATVVTSLCIGLTPFTAQASGVPTVDIAAIANMVKQMMEDAKHYEDVLGNWKDQIQNSQAQLQSMTGVRNVGSMVNDLNRLSSTTKGILTSLSNPKNLIDNGFDALDTDAKKIMEQYGVGNRCKENFKENKELKNLCEGEIIANITLIERKQQITKELEALLRKVSEMSRIADTTTDLKASQDLANQIGLVQSSLSILQLNYQMIITDEKTFSSAVEEKKGTWRTNNKKSVNAVFKNPLDSGSANPDQW